MTSLDPSHIPTLRPGHESRTKGQAVHTSVTPLHHLSEKGPRRRARSSSSTSSSSTSSSVSSTEARLGEEGQTSWRGAWARRQALRAQQREQNERTRDEEAEGIRKMGRIPVPPIPDLRYEQGILLSIRPFLHLNESSIASTSGDSTSSRKTDDHNSISSSVGDNKQKLQSPNDEKGRSKEYDDEADHDLTFESGKEQRHEDRIETEQKAALVSTFLTSEGSKEQARKQEHRQEEEIYGRDGNDRDSTPPVHGTTSDLKPIESDIFMGGPLRIEWGQITYVIVRDQVVFPLLQGILWGVGGLWLNSLWTWNKDRLNAKATVSPGGLPRNGVGRMLNKLGVRFR